VDAGQSEFDFAVDSSKQRCRASDTNSATRTKYAGSAGRPGPVRTYEDLLTSPHDEDLFEYYATSQIALVDSSSARSRLIGKASLFQDIDVAPDGTHILVARIKRPFSYLFTDNAFPKDIEVWDTKGRLVYTVASLPLANQVPIDGVITGPRFIRWRPWLHRSRKYRARSV
jgi:hypothetical protein